MKQRVQWWIGVKNPFQASCLVLSCCLCRHFLVAYLWQALTACIQRFHLIYIWRHTREMWGFKHHPHICLPNRVLPLTHTTSPLTFTATAVFNAFHLLKLVLCYYKPKFQLFGSGNSFCLFLLVVLFSFFFKVNMRTSFLAASMLAVRNSCSSLGLKGEFLGLFISPCYYRLQGRREKKTCNAGVAAFLLPLRSQNNPFCADVESCFHWLVQAPRALTFLQNIKIHLLSYLAFSSTVLQ